MYVLEPTTIHRLQYSANLVDMLVLEGGCCSIREGQAVYLMRFGLVLLRDWKLGSERTNTW